MWEPYVCFGLTYDVPTMTDQRLASAFKWYVGKARRPFEPAGPCFVLFCSATTFLGSCSFLQRYVWFCKNKFRLFWTRQRFDYFFDSTHPLNGVFLECIYLK